LDLAAGVFEGARGVDFFGGVAEFFGGRELCGDAESGVLVGEAAAAEAFELLFGAAPGDDETVEFLVVVGFDEEGGFDEGCFAVALASPLAELLMDEGFNARVQDRIEAREFGGVGKNNGGEFGAVDLLRGVENSRTEIAQDFVVGGLTAGDELVGERIGVEDIEAEFAEHGGYGGFSSGDASGKAEAAHAGGHRAPAECTVSAAEVAVFRRRKSAAFTVLLMSMVIVMGPTPPGTGVRAPAVLMASG